MAVVLNEVAPAEVQQHPHDHFVDEAVYLSIRLMAKAHDYLTKLGGGQTAANLVLALTALKRTSSSRIDVPKPMLKCVEGGRVGKLQQRQDPAAAGPTDFAQARIPPRLQSSIPIGLARSRSNACPYGLCVTGEKGTVSYCTVGTSFTVGYPRYDEDGPL